eukprot:5057054-Amphidinium_carterae.1
MHPQSLYMCNLETPFRQTNWHTQPYGRVRVWGIFSCPDNTTSGHKRPENLHILWKKLQSLASDGTEDFAIFPYTTSTQLMVRRIRDHVHCQGQSTFVQIDQPRSQT